ncbi:MAG TPA: PKD domain-containing protein [Thermomonospora sp.]|nr:PKD domain-containing protein [Thermomonospora sp.]
MSKKADRRTRRAVTALLVLPALASLGLQATSNAATAAAPAATGPLSRYLLVGGTGSGDLTVFRADRDGTLTKVPGSPFKTRTGFAVVVTPDARKVYVAGLGGVITGHRIGDDGALTPIPGSEIDFGMPVVGLAVTPDGSRLFATMGRARTRAGEVRSFAIASSGALTPTGRPATPLGENTFLSQPALTPDGRTLIVTHFGGGKASSFRVAPDAGLTRVGEPIAVGDGPALPSITPDGRFLYVTNEQGGDIAGFAIGSGGALTPTPGSPYPAGSLPHGVAITPDSRHLYLPEAGGKKLDGFRIGDDGALTALPGSPYAAPQYGMPGRVVLTPDSSRMYVIDVLTRSLTSKVHTYTVGADGGLAPSGQPAADSGVLFSDGPAAVMTPNQAPVAALRTVRSSGSTRTFSAADSTDADGRVVKYHWDFGGGETVTTTGPEVTRAFTGTGTHTVTVTVTDDEGCSTELNYTGQTTVCGGGPQARASLTINLG